MTVFELLLLLGSVFGLGHVLLLHQHLRNHVNEDNRSNTSTPLLCYFGLDPGWPDNGTLHPALSATLCSHLIFIGTTVKDGVIVEQHPSDVSKYFNKIPLLRQQNPELKVLITNGGGNSHAFSAVLGSEANRTRFVDSAIPFLKKYDFDGLDLDFEFPGWNGLPKGQRKNFTLLTQELRDAFDKEATSSARKYVLTAAVAAGRAVMEIYDVPSLAKSLDYINLMCYDLYEYSPIDPITGFNSPLYPDTWQRHIPISRGNVGWSSYEWYKRGMPKSKIAVGFPTYIHTWKLMFPDRYHGPDSPATGPGLHDFDGYHWVCQFVKENGTTKVWDKEAAVPYAYNGPEWVSYDDVRSLTAKTEWTIKNGFGAIMVFSMNADDFYGTCGEGRRPLVSAIRSVIDSMTSSDNMKISN